MLGDKTAVATYSLTIFKENTKIFLEISPPTTALRKYQIPLLEHYTINRVNDYQAGEGD